MSCSHFEICYRVPEPPVERKGAKTAAAPTAELFIAHFFTELLVFALFFDKISRRS